MKAIYKYRNLRQICTLNKHFQTENLSFFVLSWKCYGLSRVKFYLYSGISILIWININIQVASWRNGLGVCLACKRTRDRIPLWERIFHFEIIACFPCRTSRQCNFK